jgi:tellurite resistance protein TerB
MSGFLDTLTQHYRQQLERHRQLPFLRAAMAACAYVVTGDGRVTLRERVGVDRVLETLDRLKVFDPHEGVDLFNGFVDALRTSEPEGRRLVLEALDAEVAEEPDKAGLLLRICLAVSEGPQGIPDGERERVTALCRHLRLEPCPGLQVGD